MAANYTIEQLLGYVHLTGLVEAIKTGIPDVLPPEWWSNKKRVVRDQGRYTRVSGTRATARRSEYGSPAIQRKLSEVGIFDVKLRHTLEHIDLPITTYMSLRGYTTYDHSGDIAQEEIARQAQLFRVLFDNLSKAEVYSTLANGIIWYDTNGNLLPSSSGAAVTIDFGVSANHKNQLNGIIDVSWAVNTSNIVVHIAKVLRQSVLDTGYNIESALYGVNIPSYMANNLLAQPYMARSPNMREKFMDTGAVPDGVFGVAKYIPVAQAFFEDSAGTNQLIFGDDTVTFSPKPDGFWWEILEGTFPVPTTFQPLVGLPETAKSFEMKQGMFAFGVPVDAGGVATARMYAGDIRLNIVKVPDCLFVADVTP